MSQDERYHLLDAGELSEVEQVALISQQPAQKVWPERGLAQVRSRWVASDRVDRARRGRHRPVELIPQRGERASQLDLDFGAAAEERTPEFWPMGVEGQTVWEGVPRVLGEEKVISLRPPHPS